VRLPELTKSPGDTVKGHDADNRRIYSVDRLWEIQQEKLLSRLGGNPDVETKDGFVQRIRESYGLEQ